MSSYVAPAGSSTCTNPRVRACARLQAVHAGTGTRMHAHAHTRTHAHAGPLTPAQLAADGAPGARRGPSSPLTMVPSSRGSSGRHTVFPSSRRRLVLTSSRADLVQALGSAPSHPIRDPACTPVGLSPTTSSQCLLQPPTSSALPEKAQLQGLHEEAHSATASSAPKGGQAPPWVGTRGCCPRATWGPPMRSQTHLTTSGRKRNYKQASFSKLAFPYRVVPGDSPQGQGDIWVQGKSPSS